MKIYTGDGNPTGRKVAAVCEHLNLDYDLEILGFEQGDTQAESFKKMNPNGLVPVLQDGAKVIYESNAIIVYLAARKVPDSSLYKPDSRAEILQWMFWEAAQYNASLRMIINELIIKPRFNLGETEPAVVAEATKKFTRWSAVLDQHLADKTFLVGNDWTLADYAVGYLAPVVKNLNLDLSAVPNVEAYYQRFENNPYWAATGKSG